MDAKEILDTATWIVEYAQKKGADGCVATLFGRREINVSYRDRKLEDMKEASKKLMYLEIYINNRFAVHFTNNIKREPLKRFIEEAVKSTGYLAEDRYRSMPDPKYYPKSFEKDLKIFDEGYFEVTAARRKQIASEIEAAALSQSDKIVSVSSWYSDGLEEGVRVHSNGLIGPWKATNYNAGASVSVNDPSGGKPSGWDNAVMRNLQDMPSPEVLGAAAVKRALSRIGQSKIASGTFDMLVENRVANRVVGMLTYPMTGGALQQKNSFLESMKGKQIASDKFTLIDDRLLEKGMGTNYFDIEGMAAARRPMIEKGVLKNYYINNYYSKKLNMEPTTGETSNLVFDTGDNALAQLIKEMDKGILVRQFIGGNSNSLTGDFSFGVVGDLIENGQIVKPVNEMNISGNAIDFWMRLAKAGNDPYRHSAWQTPSMLFEDVVFSGI